MPNIPSPSILQLLEIDQPGEFTDICQLARLIHRKALLKIASTEVDCLDMYNLEGREVIKAQMIRMLRDTANWAASIVRQCDGSQIASALPTYAIPYHAPHDITFFP